MTRCKHCHEEIEFRTLDGKRTPIHVGGSGCQGSPFSDLHPRSRSAQTYRDLCRPVRCKDCGRQVFYIEHNGGCLWVDELGWPWPKHACRAKAEVPHWYRYFTDQYPDFTTRSLVFGLVVRAVRRAKDSRGPSRLLLEVECPDTQRVLIATTGGNTAEYLLNRFVVLDEANRTMLTSNVERRSLLDIQVSASDFSAVGA